MKITSNNAAKQDFMPLMRALVRAYQAFATVDAEGFRVRASGLTTSQADVLFTLGNTPGMTCGEIGEKTLITKGTLTGVIDRLEAKKLLKRYRDTEDGRRIVIRLTAKGERLFEEEFPAQITWLKGRFDQLSQAQKRQAIEALNQLLGVFS